MNQRSANARKMIIHSNDHVLINAAEFLNESYWFANRRRFSSCRRVQFGIEEGSLNCYFLGGGLVTSFVVFFSPRIELGATGCRVSAACSRCWWLDGSRRESAAVTWVIHSITAINNGSRLDGPLSAYSAGCVHLKTRHNTPAFLFTVTSTSTLCCMSVV